VLSFLSSVSRASRAVELYLSLGMVAVAASPFVAVPHVDAQHLHHSQTSQLAQGGEGGEGGESGHSQAASSDTEILVVLAQMQGHLLVAQELLSRGNTQAAEPHVGHPVDELYGSLEAVIAKGRLQPFRDSLEVLRQQVRLAPTSPGTALKMVKAQQALQAATATVAPSLNRQPQLLLAVTRQLALSAASEYEAAVADDRIAETIEYQDARGFLLQAQRLLRQAITEAPAAGVQAALSRIEAMLKAFPSPVPPKRIVLRVSQLKTLAGSI
jgi:hypothetical protein